MDELGLTGAIQTLIVGNRNRSVTINSIIVGSNYIQIAVIVDVDHFDFKMEPRRQLAGSQLNSSEVDLPVDANAVIQIQGVDVVVPTTHHKIYIAIAVYITRGDTHIRVVSDFSDQLSCVVGKAIGVRIAIIYEQF